MAYSSKTVEGGNREYVPFAVRHPSARPHPAPPPAPALLLLQAIKAFRAKLEAKRFPIGPSIGIKDPVVTDGIADEVDYIWYDQEHSTMVRPACSNPRPLRCAQPYYPLAARRAPTSCRTTSSQRTAAACLSSSASPAPTSATPPRPE